MGVGSASLVTLCLISVKAVVGVFLNPAWRGSGFEVIEAVTTATVLAQALKIVWYFITHGKINFKIFFHTGGMPSSHSASVAALATSVGLIDGWNSTPFAIALGLAAIVMYDAAGVRRAAGKMAGILNRITDDLYQHHSGDIPERLRELLGHTPFEVLVGCAFGAAVAMGIHSGGL